ncbi:hypothetical protein KFE25_008660 [Diacronema lutheri]|uniref:carnosine N-methyltransferase n=1 Tax=Diacronema lutheri TaxID=2081491 RepID=A0A8J5Y2X4_DIALT|nr:hypothetical protein KFE25_008660 [Diacronema lutheri]
MAATEMDGGDEDEEHVHFKQVLRAYEHYREHAHARISEMECHAARLDRASRELLRLEDKFAALRRAVECNGRVLDAIVEPHAMFEDDEQAGRSMHARALLERPAAGRGATPSDADMEKVKSTLKQLARDWAEEGAAERAACYGPLLADIERLLPSESAARPNAKVLVPGAGLGRLAWECAARGFACQGNEVSYFMLLASNFVLNHAADLGQLEIYPYVHQSINVRAPADQLRPVPLPDTDPSRLPAHTPFSMCAGDFLAIYANQPGEWDCILTCFFIDTARDVSQYVRTIHAALRPGGVWCNVGPLLYHWAEMGPAEFSIELSWEELRALIVAHGFAIELEEWLPPMTYAANARSMLKMEYECVHTVCRKAGVQHR